MDDYEFAESVVASGITEEQLKEMLRASRETPAPENAPVVTPTPTATVTPEADSPLARAEAALAAKADREKLVAGAKALLAERIGEEPDGFTDEELLYHAGLGNRPGETPQERAHRERIENENDLASNPARRAEYEALLRDREVEELRRTYWQLHPAQREQRIEELGLTDFEPPTSFNGL